MVNKKMGKISMWEQYNKQERCFDNCKGIRVTFKRYFMDDVKPYKWGEWFIDRTEKHDTVFNEDIYSEKDLRRIIKLFKLLNKQGE